MNKKLIIIAPHSFIDTITNSSSELFIMNNQEKEQLEIILNEIYPNYLNEYEPLKDVNDFSIEELNSFLYWHLGRTSSSWCSKQIYNNPNDYQILSGFTFDEIYDTSILYNNEYQIRNNILKNKQMDEYDNSFVTEENKERVINAIINDIGRYFLYSIGENPDWDIQEKLMEIGTRYHLG